LHLPFIEKAAAIPRFLPRNHFQDKSFTLSTRFSTVEDPPAKITSLWDVQIDNTTICQTRVGI
jgi:hypothetical protein